MSQYLYRGYQKGDEQKLDSLIRNVWGEKITSDFGKYLDYLVLKNPYNKTKEIKMQIIEHEGDIVGMCLYLPTLINVLEKKVPAYFIGHIMTHTEHRGRGMMIIRNFFSEPDWIIGFPLPATEKIYLHAGTKKPLIDRILYVAAYIDLSRAIRAKLGKFGFLSPLFFLWNLYMTALLFIRKPRSGETAIAKHDGFPAALDDFIDENQKSYGAMVNKNVEFLEWRYLRCPFHKYSILIAKSGGRITGYLVYRTGDFSGLQKGFLVDFLVKHDDSTTFKKLAHFAVTDLRKRGCAVISTVLSPAPAFYRKVLKRYGFYTTKENTMFIDNNFFDAYTAQNNIDSPVEWYLTAGDSDTDIMMV